MGDMIDMMELAVDVVGTADSLSSVDVSIFIWHWYNVQFRIDLSDFRSILSDFGSIRLSVSDRLMAHGRWMV